MKPWTEQLYRLLPAIHQIRDGEQGEPLRQFLYVVGEQMQLVQEDIEQLYDNWFIESCDDWVVPYLGDLVGFRRVEDAGQPADAMHDRGRLLNRFLFPRREIANLVRRRRRKGTLSVLEDIANDTAGWPARAVEFSRRVAFFQNVRHPQPELGGTLCVRDREATVRVQTPFDRVAHTVDVRQIQSQPGVGWYHPKKVGLFVWRRKVYSATKVRPCESCVNKGDHIRVYTFNRLGHFAPLYVNPQAESDELGTAEERHLPVPLYRHLLADQHGHAATAYYGLGFGEAASMAIFARWTGAEKVELIQNGDVLVCDLRDRGKWRSVARSLKSRQVAVDPECGLFLFGCGSRPDQVAVSYHYAFGADLGGGEYKRPAVFDVATTTVRIRSKPGAVLDNLLHRAYCELKTAGLAAISRCGTQPASGPLLQRDPNGTGECAEKKAVTKWTVNGKLCIEITSSETFVISAAESLEIADRGELEIRAANGAWPLIKIESTNSQPCGNDWCVKLGCGSRLVLDGLQICGATVRVCDRDVGKCAAEKQGTSGGCGPSPCESRLATPSCEGVSPRQPNGVVIRHTTFVPAGDAARGLCSAFPLHASLKLSLVQGTLCIQHSILGGLDIQRPGDCHDAESKNGSACPVEPLRVAIADSILQVPRNGGSFAIHADCCDPAYADLTVERSTILGDVCVRQISRAEDSLFVGTVHVERRGHGYLRFCYVPPKPTGDDKCCSVKTPQRFKCLPVSTVQTPTRNRTCSAACDQQLTLPAEQLATDLRPVFVSTRYGDPGYCQLALDCPRAILRGAEDESELGVFHDQYHSQRAAALAARLQEYTPADMQSAVIYADDLHPLVFPTIHRDS